MKRLLSVALSLVIIVSSVFCVSVISYADETFDFGDNVTATYTDSNKTLTLSGTGTTADYNVAGTNPLQIKDYHTKIETLVINEGITGIGECAFSVVQTLKNVTFPSTLQSIGKNAFSGCMYIEQFDIPASVTYINPTALRTATSSSPTRLQSINVSENNPNYCSVDGILYDKALTTLITVPSANATEILVLPDTIEYFIDSAAVYCRGLKQLIIPESIKAVGSKTFEKCTKLERVVIKNPDIMLNPASELFKGNTKLTIVGYEGSTAQTFAEECGYTFEAIEVKCPHEETTLANVKKRTCLEDGYTGDKICNKCGEPVEMGEVIKSYGGHSCSTSDKVTPATKKANGKIVRTTACKRCDYKTTKTTKTIYKISSVKLNYSTLTYNAEVRNVGTTIKDSKGNTLKKGTDYTVSWDKGRKYVGKYACKVKFKGNYSGSETLYLTIKPKSTSIKKLTAKSKGIKVEWKKQKSQTTGYQIQYATDKSFTKNTGKVTVSNINTASKSLSNLKGKKKYFVRIRTYKTVKINGKNEKIYSAWSGYKTITTKK